MYKLSENTFFDWYEPIIFRKDMRNSFILLVINELNHFIDVENGREANFFNNVFVVLLVLNVD